MKFNKHKHNKSKMQKRYAKNKSLRLKKKITRRGGAGAAGKTKKKSSSRSSSPKELCKFNLMCKNGDYYESKPIYTSEASARAAAKEYADTRGGVHRVSLVCS
jgi:hypothetical protein